MQRKPTFYSIQILRGLAATLVVLFHVTQNLQQHSDFTAVRVFWAGNGGVDLFFLISGFVIYSTTMGEWQVPGAWARFLSRRFTRIIPLYWLMTTIKLASLVAVPAVLERPELAAWQAVASYLFIPAWDSSHSVVAIIAAGWTLCFEMFFYYICAVCLALGTRPLVVMTPLFAALAAVGLFRTPAWGAPATLLDPLLLEFIAGMWIGQLAMTSGVKLGPFAASGLLLVGCAALVASGLLPSQEAYRLRVLVWGLPAVAIVLGFVALETRVNFRGMRLPLLLGNASYAIYLTELSVRPLISALRHFHVGAAGQYVAVVVVSCAALGIGVMVYWFVEQPLLKGVRAAFRPARPAVLASPPTSV